MKGFGANLLWSLCGIIDHIPVRRNGRWQTSQWGCWPLRISDLAIRLERTT